MPAQFDITRDVVNIGVPPNKKFGFVTYVKNIGDEAGTCVLDMRDHANQIRGKVEVVIDPGEERRVVVWAENPFDVGSYGWSLYALNKENNYNIDDRDDFQLDSTTDIGWFEITNVPSSIDATTNESVTLSVKVKNVGGAQGLCYVYLKLGDSVIDRKEYTLQAGEEVDVQFTFTAPSEAGSYNLRVELYRIDDQLITDEASIQLNVTSPTTAPSPTSPFDITSLFAMLFPIMIIVLIVIFIIMLFKK